MNKTEGLFLFGTGFLIRHQTQKVYKNNILYSVYSEFKENIWLNNFLSRVSEGARWHRDSGGGGCSSPEKGKGAGCIEF